MRDFLFVAGLCAVVIAGQLCCAYVIKWGINRLRARFNKEGE